VGTYSQEFKVQIVELHRKGGRTFMDLAKEFNLSPTTISNWVRATEQAERRAERGSKTPAKAAAAVEQETEAAKVARLERELARKDEELRILGKALAFFARRMDP